jgi:putative ATP-dependent endonuclease of OLD family
MKLTYFSIGDYRSISKAVLNDLQAAAILIGPNNEGKSNILQGLNACLTLLTEGRVVRSKDELRLYYDRDTYDWSLDYPIRKQRDRVGESVFVLKFKLSPTERQQFQSTTGSALNEALPIELRFGPQTATFRVLKQGRGGTALTAKPAKICEFISQTLDFVYIPAIRAADQSKELVNELVSLELRRLEKNPRYLELVNEVEVLQKPVLEGLASRLEGNLRKFLGSSLKGVKLNMSRHRLLGRSCRIVVDDGTPTVLERKGDGVQSLVAIRSHLINGFSPDTLQLGPEF